LEKLENDDAIHHDFDDMYFNGAERNTTVVYHWTLGLVMRQQNTKLITLLTNLKSWIQSLPQTDAEG